MKQIWLELKTLSDVVVSREAGTSMGHETLDYIPGAALMGAAITALGFDAPLFLSGILRFSDAWPAVDGAIAWPLPLSFHYSKVKGRNGPLFSGLQDVYGQALAACGSPQVEQHRTGHVTLAGETVEVMREYRIKSAMDRNTMGRSADGQLFGYEAIREGQTFVARLLATGKAESRIDDVVNVLLAHPVRMGRSKSAEYGRVKVHKCTAVPAMPEVKPGPTAVLYLASDLLLTRAGMPVLQPVAADFGMPPDCEIDWDKTFLRHRTYSPWNAFYNGRMSGRQLIGRGSVITFNPSSGVDMAALAVRLQNGVGNAREEGCGVVLLNPSFVVNPPASLNSHKAQKPLSLRASPASPLARYVATRYRLCTIEPEALTLGRAWKTELMTHQCKLEKDFDKVPGKSQWGTIRGFAAAARDDLHVLRNMLRKYCTEDMRCQLWSGQTARRDGKWLSLYDLICSLSGLNAERAPAKDDSNALMVRSLYHAALEMSRDLGRKGEDKGGKEQ